MHTVYLSLGSNLGDRKATMRRAIGLLNERAGSVIRIAFIASLKTTTARRKPSASHVATSAD
jgi:7,8-dihydro-6-hydroxymethylpterin-pyrophosphokinase